MTIKPQYLLIVSVFMFFAVPTNNHADGKNNITYKVISTKIVDKVDGLNGINMTWKDAKTAKGIVIGVEAKVPSDMTLWSTDLSISYLLKGKKDTETRGSCLAMTIAQASPEDEESWIVGDSVKLAVKAGTRYIKLLFEVENNINTVSMNYSYPVAKNIAVNRN